MKHVLKVGFIVAVATVVLSFSAQAEPHSDTLSKIRDVGEISLGHRDVSVPFSYLDGTQKPVGFAMDLCGEVVKAVAIRLDMPTLRVRLEPVQLNNQIQLIQDGTIDIVCGPTTNTLKRQGVVAFSNTIFVSSIRAVVRAGSQIKTFEDMADKVVSLTAASTSIDLLRAREQARVFQTEKEIYPDHSTAFLALIIGKADAFVMDDVLLSGLVANSLNPKKWRIIDDALRVEPYGLVLPKNDATFKALVDETLGALNESGGFEKLYNKWFMSPIPPKDVNLNFPMSAPLKDALANPNDRGV